MIRFSLLLAVVVTISTFCQQPARAQANDADGGIIEVHMTASTLLKNGSLDYRYSKHAWEALEERAKKAASDGYSGEAEYLFDQARIYALRRTPDNSQLLISLHDEAKFYAKLGKVDDAERLYELAYTQYRADKNSQHMLAEKAQILSEYATILSTSGNASKSETVAKDSKALAAAAAEQASKNQIPWQPPINAATNADVDIGPYIATLQRKVLEKWRPLRRDCDQIRVVVVFKLDKEGAVSNLRLDHPSKSETANASALKAIESAAPFGQLPLGSDMDIYCQFDGITKHPVRPVRGKVVPAGQEPAKPKQ